MRYFQCKCGGHKAWSTMGSPACRVCEDCGSTLAEGLNTHPTPIPHSVYAQIYHGKLDVRCSRCHSERPLSEAANLYDVQREVEALHAALFSVVTYHAHVS